MRAPRAPYHFLENTVGRHVTLTVQSSDLNWSAFVRDGLAELHRRRNEARLPLPLDPGFGGYEGCLASGGGRKRDAGITTLGGR